MLRFQYSLELSFSSALENDNVITITTITPAIYNGLNELKIFPNRWKKLVPFT
jgi:hypothetical protein